MIRGCSQIYVKSLHCLSHMQEGQVWLQNRCNMGLMPHVFKHWLATAALLGSALGGLFQPGSDLPYAKQDNSDPYADR